MTNRISSEITGGSVLILGYGREGKCVHRYLCSVAPQLRIAVCDEQAVELIAEASPDCAVFTGKECFLRAPRCTTLIRSPGLSPMKIPPALRDDAWQTSLMNIFFSLAPGKIIGVTGTKGKSTTSSLIHRVLSTHYRDVRLVGNIGLPALDYLPGASADTIFVCELSSFQLEDLRFSPHIAVLLEIFPEHLDHHGTFEQYERAKLNITVNQRTNDFLVINKFQYKHPQLSLMTSANRVFFTEEPTTGSSVFLDNNCITIAQNGEAIPLLRADELRLLGRGNIRNTLAAVSVCSLCGVPSGHIAQELRNFEPLEHRLEYVGEFRGIKFYNDSLSTIPQAAINALDALKLDVATMILGGHDRGVDYTPLGPAVMESAVRTIILMPGSGERIWEAIRRAGNKADRLPRKFAVSSLEEAVRIAYQETPEGKTCLLSPASSSLNMFRDYRERGEIFRSCVRKFGLE